MPPRTVCSVASSGKSRFIQSRSTDPTSCRRPPRRRSGMSFRHGKGQRARSACSEILHALFTQPVDCHSSGVFLAQVSNYTCSAVGSRSVGPGSLEHRVGTVSCPLHTGGRVHLPLVSGEYIRSTWSPPVSSQAASSCSAKPYGLYYPLRASLSHPTCSLVSPHSPFSLSLSLLSRPRLRWRSAKEPATPAPFSAVCSLRRSVYSPHWA